MREANGIMPVSQVAAAHMPPYVHLREVQAIFRLYVKDVSGLMRFEQVRNQLWLYPDSNIASLAYELGYTDQST